MTLERAGMMPPDVPPAAFLFFRYLVLLLRERRC